MAPQNNNDQLICAFYSVVMINCVLLLLYYAPQLEIHSTKPRFKQGFVIQPSWVRYLLVKEGKLNETCVLGVSNQPHVNMTEVKRSNLTDLNSLEVKAYVEVHCLRISHVCTPTTVGRSSVNTTSITLEELLYEKELNFVNSGGWWSPDDCLATQHTAIIIPFRNRYQHLSVLVRHLHPVLKRQRLHYRIFVAEQDDGNDFNKGKLMNLAFKEALKIFPYSCFIFHDVDLLPEDDRIMYSCSHSPMHLSPAVSTFKYRMPYSWLFGGVTMFTPADFRRLNGFSNLFWSWGGEDDNMYHRTRDNGMRLHRESMEIGKYTMLSHASSKPTRNAKLTGLTGLYARKYQKKDGVNSVQYEIKEINNHQLFTKIKVSFTRAKDNSFGLAEELIKKGILPKKGGKKRM